MISQIATKYLRKTAENCYFWASATFYLSPEENRLIVSQSIWRKFFSAFNFSFHISYALFLLVRLLHITYFSRGEVEEHSEFFLEAFGLACMVPFCCHLYFFWREETFANFVNQYLTYCRNIEGYWKCLMQCM